MGGAEYGRPSPQKGTPTAGPTPSLGPLTKNAYGVNVTRPVAPRKHSPKKAKGGKR